VVGKVTKRRYIELQRHIWLDFASSRLINSYEKEVMAKEILLLT
jgi:hypothetical protein